MHIRDRRVETPTVARLRAERGRASASRPYGFYLSEIEFVRLAEGGISPAAILAYALIRSAARAALGREPVSIRPRVRDAWARDWRWWHRVSRELERAGFIACERHRGRLPRYRVVSRGRRLTVRCGAAEASAM